MSEIWKNIKGYEGLYEVSDLGNVRNSKTGRILRYGSNGAGYAIVILRKDKLSKNKRVHRLVAEAFIPNPDNLPEVNHINEIKTDNSADNLEWCTVKYNRNYGNRIKKIEKPITQYTIDGNFVAYWQSGAEVERALGFNKSNISACCRGLKHHNTAYGYVWKWTDTFFENYT